MEIKKMRRLVITLAASFVSLFSNLSVSLAEAQDTVLTSRNAFRVCNIASEDWVNFCNGLIQGYADYAVLSGNACIPAGTTRTTLITVYIDRLPATQAYANDAPALLAAVEVLKRAYPCR